MNKQIRNGDKRIVMLLIASFAWLFIGSLIVFHQEHVMGKHFRLNSQMFISPKTKDKQNLTFKLQPSKNASAQAGFAWTCSRECSVTVAAHFINLKPKETSSFYSEDVLLTDSPLRAPPVI